MPGRRSHPLRVRLVTAILVIAFLLSVAAVLPGCGETYPVVVTKYGKVEGRTGQREMLVFKGIPYARAPLKDLRFKPPEPPKPWEDTLEALQFGPSAPQTTEDISSSAQKQSEDCLYLNVWTPGTDDARRPVMVWIHGGGFTNGSGGGDWYDGSAFAARGDVVVVTINYRLGALGFLYLGGVGGTEYAESGNLGLLDQVASLEWVKDNIAAFGGDPGNVTIFGESAGGMSVCTLLGTPAAGGLFRRAIAQSGAANLVRNASYAAEITSKFMSRAGVSDIEGLKSLTADEIVEVQGGVLAEEPPGGTPFGPTTDGAVLPEPPLHAIAKGSAADVDLLIGTNLDEVRFWLIGAPQLAIAPLEYALDYLPMVRDAVGKRTKSVKASYKSRRPDADDGDITMAVTTDVMFRAPAIRVAEAQSTRQPNTRMYLFTWPSPVRDGILGACHAIEIPFVFNALHVSHSIELLGSDPPQALADGVQDAWIAFARKGDPSGTGKAGVPAWPRYDLQSRATMILNVNPAVENDPYSADRLLWEGIPFDSVEPAMQ